jgi:2'-5' RNA ligase
MRLFFAVPLTDDVRGIVHRAVGEIPLDPPPWRWIAPQNYHITLKFLGDVEEPLLLPVREAASRAAEASSSFDLSFDRFGAFPSISRPRVLFYAAEKGSEDLTSLAGRLEEELVPLGFEKERRRFHAHLTLARVRRSPLPEVQRILESIDGLPEPARQLVDRFVLMKSTLLRSGARYDELDSFPLAG